MEWLNVLHLLYVMMKLLMVYIRVELDAETEGSFVFI